MRSYDLLVKEAVARGIALLTDKELKKIDLQTLELGSVVHCPLGQTRGWYTDSIPMWDRFHHGFTTGGLPILALLNYEWRKQLLAKREQARAIDGRKR